MDAADAAFDWRPHYLSLARELGLLGEAMLPRLSLGAGDPMLASPHRIATAAALAAAVQGTAIDALWQARGGHAQHLRIPADAALHTLNSTFFLKQNGHRIGMGSGGRHEPLNTFYRAGNRWFRFVGSRPDHRDRILALLGCANTQAAIAAAVAGRDPWQLEQQCADLGVPGVVARSREEWRAHPQGQALADAPLIRVTRLADGPPAPLAAGQRPLSGLRVLDLTHVLAGPASSRTLAAQGADVLRLSSPRGCDDPLYMVIDTGFGKHNAYVDLADPADLARTHRLASQADVLVQSYRHGSLGRHGLSPEQLCRHNPGLVYASISCYGPGPWHARPGFDPNAAAATGICLDEARDGIPALPPTTLVCDFLTGYLAAAGIGAALLRRCAEGGSYHVEVSLARTAMWVQDLGLVPAAHYLSRPRQLDPDVALAAMDSPFGRLDYLPPIPHYSDTPAFWDSPPLPLGANGPCWHGDRLSPDC